MLIICLYRHLIIIGVRAGVGAPYTQRFAKNISSRMALCCRSMLEKESCRTVCKGEASADEFFVDFQGLLPDNCPIEVLADQIPGLRIFLDFLDFLRMINDM